MTQILAANIGSYPRIGEEKDQQRHKRGLANFTKNEISAHAFRDVQESVVQEVIREQIASGLDEITDGLISWPDPISQFTGKVSGIKHQGLMRYFDTNFYYSVPTITGQPRKKDPFILPDFLYAKEISNKPLRIIVTGPYTLARHTKSEIRSFQRLENRLRLFTDLLLQELKALGAHGALHIQLDEPSIAKHPEDWKLFSNNLDRFFSSVGKMKLSIAVYFSPVVDIYDHLTSLPLHSLNFEFLGDPKRLTEKILATPLEISLGLGIVNARQTRLEAIDPLLNFIRTLIDKKNPDLCYVTPSCGLEFLPRDVAFQKLKLLSKIRDEINSWYPVPSPTAHE